MDAQPSLIQRDLQHIWHPCSQMKDFEQSPPFVIHQAKGSYLYTDKGPVIDAISSWWCKSLGHGHPAVIDAIKKQLDCFEHVIGANSTHPSIVELAEHLYAISNKPHVFFASDGSSSVEIAMKLALQATQLKGYAKRNQFIALSNGYHGETLGTLSVSDLGRFKQPFEGFGVDCHFISPPYVHNTHDPLWQSCDLTWNDTFITLDAIKSTVCAVIVEPIIQGAGGMLCYSADFLRQLARWAKENDIYLIADEIMTGMGRTGLWLACHHAQVEPDMICLSKGLTSGSLPLSCVLIDKAIYDLFYHDYNQGPSFLHSHTYSGNPLAVCAALATIQTMHTEHINQQAQALGASMRRLFDDIATQTNQLTNVRSIGAMVAGDLNPSKHLRTGFILAQEALKRGALLRPIGNTLYWLPPLNTSVQTLEALADITLHSIKAVYRD